MASQWQRTLLVHGFGREHCASQLPVDVLSACLCMFGLDGFAFRVLPKHLRHFHFYRSPIYCCQHVDFQIIIKRNEGRSSFGFGNADTQRLHMFVRFIDPKRENRKITSLVARFSLRCLGYHAECILHPEFQRPDTLRKGESEVEVDSHGRWMYLSEKGLTAESAPLIFSGNLELIHLNVLDTQRHVLRRFHQPTTMPRSVHYKCVLSKATFVSPALGRDNWRLHFREASPSKASPVGSNSQSHLKLQLLSLPPRIRSLCVAWRCSFECRGQSFGNMSVGQIELGGTSELCMSLPNELLSTQRGAIAVDAHIEVVHANEVKFVDGVNEAAHWGFGQNIHLTPESLSDAQLRSFGIVEGAGDAVANSKRLVLQKEVERVKMRSSAPNEFGATLLFIADADEVDEVEDVQSTQPVAAASSARPSRWTARSLFCASAAQTAPSTGTSVTRTGAQVESKEEEEEKNDFECIRDVLRAATRFPAKADNILQRFKQHEVTDSRVCDLEQDDWKRLVPQIGIRNEMKKVFRGK